MKRLFALILTTILVCSLLNVSFASQNLDVEQTVIDINVRFLHVFTETVPEEVVVYAEKEIKAVLGFIKNNSDTYGLEIDTFEDYYLGNPFYIYNLNNGQLCFGGVYAFPVLYKNQVKAIATISRNESGLSMSFGKMYADTLSSFIDKQNDSEDNPYIFMSVGDQLIVVNRSYSTGW